MDPRDTIVLEAELIGQFDHIGSDVCVVATIAAVTKHQVPEDHPMYRDITSMATLIGQDWLDTSFARNRSPEPADPLDQIRDLVAACSTPRSAYRASLSSLREQILLARAALDEQPPVLEAPEVQTSVLGGATPAEEGLTTLEKLRRDLAAEKVQTAIIEEKLVDHCLLDEMKSAQQKASTQTAAILEAPAMLVDTANDCIGSLERELASQTTEVDVLEQRLLNQKFFIVDSTCRVIDMDNLHKDLEGTRRKAEGAAVIAEHHRVQQMTTIRTLKAELESERQQQAEVLVEHQSTTEALEESRRAIEIERDELRVRVSELEALVDAERRDKGRYFGKSILATVTNIVAEKSLQDEKKKTESLKEEKEIAETRVLELEGEIRDRESTISTLLARNEENVQERALGGTRAIAASFVIQDLSAKVAQTSADLEALDYEREACDAESGRLRVELSQVTPENEEAAQHHDLNIQKIAFFLLTHIAVESARARLALDQSASTLVRSEEHVGLLAAWLDESGNAVEDCDAIDNESPQLALKETEGLVVELFEDVEALTVENARLHAQREQLEITLLERIMDITELQTRLARLGPYVDEEVERRVLKLRHGELEVKLQGQAPEQLTSALVCEYTSTRPCVCKTKPDPSSQKSDIGLEMGVNSTKTSAEQMSLNGTTLFEAPGAVRAERTGHPSDGGDDLLGDPESLSREVDLLGDLASFVRTAQLNVEQTSIHTWLESVGSLKPSAREAGFVASPSSVPIVSNPSNPIDKSPSILSPSPSSIDVAFISHGNLLVDSSLPSLPSDRDRLVVSEHHTLVIPNSAVDASRLLSQPPPDTLSVTSSAASLNVTDIGGENDQNIVVAGPSGDVMLSSESSVDLGALPMQSLLMQTVLNVPQARPSGCVLQTGDSSVDLAGLPSQSMLMHARLHPNSTGTSSSSHSSTNNMDSNIVLDGSNPEFGSIECIPPSIEDVSGDFSGP